MSLLDKIILPALREDISLQEAPRGRGGEPHWNLYDPVRNRFFRIGWLEFELLSRWGEGGAAEDLCARVRNETPLAAEEEDVRALMHFLESNELLRASHPGSRKRLFDLSERRRLSIWQWLLHHYLFFRIPLAKPQAFLSRTLPLVEFVFSPKFFFWVGVISLIGVFRVAGQWSEFSRTFLYFFSWQGAGFYFMALAFAKFCHEMAHAYTATHYRLKVPTMGVAFVVMMPLLYTDTSEGWKLKSRKARLAIDGAGVAAELCLAGMAAFLWGFLPDGSLRSAAYILAAVTWVSTLVVNLSPFMRFDGYYLLMDAVDMPNLQQRSFAFGKWQLRRWLLGLEEAMPEAEHEGKKWWLIGYAYATWIYRFFLFTGIAALVYRYAFKAAGVILFSVEIGWFVMQPIWQEIRMWRVLREKWQGSRISRRNGFLAGLTFLWLAMPWHADIVASGYLQAEPYAMLYAPMPARIVKILVREGQVVHRGQLLVKLESPDSAYRVAGIASRIAGIRTQLSGSVANSRLFENSAVLEQELAAASAELNAEKEKAAELQVRAPHDGVFRDLGSGLYPGAWVDRHRELGLVLGGKGTTAQVYVSESDIALIRLGAHARLVTRLADARSLDGVVVSIDETAAGSLPPMLASSYGGQIAARREPGGELVPNEALYRVTIRAKNVVGEGQMIPVSASIEGARRSRLGGFFKWLAGALIRQSGF